MCPPEVDVATLRQHKRAVRERRLKAREDVRLVHMPKAKSCQGMAKRDRVIEVSTSEEAAEESEHSRGMSD